MHGCGTSGRSAGDGDGERRACGFQLSQRGGAGGGDGERRARRLQLGEPSGGRSSGDGDGERRARGFQLGRPRGSTSASAWSTSGRDGASTNGGKPSPPRDVSERPGSSRQDAPAYLTSLMVTRFIEMGFPAEKVTMALEHAGGEGDKEAAILQWLLDHEEGSSRHCTAHLTSPMVARFIEMGFSAEKVATALEHAGGGRDEEAAVLEWLVNHEETDLEGFSSSSDLEGFSSSSGDLDVFSSSTELEAFGEELTESDKFFKLVEMGFTIDEASSAITICGNFQTFP